MSEKSTLTPEQKEIDKLIGQSDFAQARQQLLQMLEENEVAGNAVWIRQKLALSTYKDTHLRPESRYEKALEHLRAIGLEEKETDNSETLGRGGAIYKRRWELDGNEAHLRTALALYKAGWQRNPEMDRGYCGVNAAYLLDLLASLNSSTSRPTIAFDNSAETLRRKARALRKEILELPAPSPKKDDYWRLVTWGELHFGLGEFSQAQTYLKQARSAEPEPWQLESTASQLVNLARWRRLIRPTAQGVQFVDSKPARECREALTALLGDQLDAALGRLRGKVGLALSGGGFRASFYHLGMLARLAEIDALRHIDVLSTVSGGSIVGVHYYLELKKLLESVPDKDVTRDDYIAIIRTVQQEFLAGVQKNLRMEILADLKTNLKMLFLGGFSRSRRLGELYEEELYAKVDDGQGAAPRSMPSLLVTPCDTPEGQNFIPRRENWRRLSKVPELVLNTTSLNSGHNFQFTASWMGEPPGLTGNEVDMNRRYRRLYYGEAPTPTLRNLRLGAAVAASSCVPGLFDPLELEGLYGLDEKRTLRLVDGGVHDNQGVAGLLDEGCDFILCSDASGQMHDETDPSSGLLGVPLRSNTILQDRIRECEYDQMHTMALSGRLKGLFFIHLKKDLAQNDITWIGGSKPPYSAPPSKTPYGIDRTIQQKLAEIRTDLDAFSEVEAYSLMLSGYRMAQQQAKALNAALGRPDETWGGFDVDAPEGEWPFLPLSEIAALPPESQDQRRRDLENQLNVGKKQMFRAAALIPRVKIRLIAAALVLAAVLLALLWFNRGATFTLGSLSVTAVILLGGLFWPKIFGWIPESRMKQTLGKVGLALGGWVIARLQISLFDPLFLKRGRLDELLELGDRAGNDHD